MTDLEIISLIEESVDTLKYVALETHIGKTKDKNLIKIVLFHPEKKISSDDCTLVADILSRRLDIDDPFQEKPYDLVVESPGLEREIKSEKEYSYFTGRDFKVFPKPHIVTKEGFFIGTLVSYKENQLVFNSETQEYRLSIEDIQKAKLHCDFAKILKENKKK